MKLLSLSRFFLLTLLGAGLIVSFSLLVPHLALAHRTAAMQRTDAPQKTITVIVLDMSGSMATNDPDGLRCSAANAYIDLSGPGNFIGVIGLDHKDADGTDSQTNFQRAESWADPVEMSTVSTKQALRAAIKQNSNNCQPDNSTPTYDALNQALQMLQKTALKNEIPGSVILLTDGAPAPDTGAQINAITNNLLPQFKQHNWPIDTVALGSDDTIQDTTSQFHTFHDFLSNVSNATAGKFYDDANGDIKGQPSPFNITPFFIDIFAQRNHRTPNEDIPLTASPNNRNFSVTDYTDSLDIVVVKDQPNTSIVLKDPQGNSVQAQGGVVSASDPHYQIFSIQQPQAGTWEVDVTGPGQFLMRSLKLSNIQLSDIGLSQNGRTLSQDAALELGQQFTSRTNITHQGQPIIDHSFALNAVVSYTGGLGKHNGPPITLDDKTTPGTYTGSITIPPGSPAGAYEIKINASTVSGAIPISSQTRSVRIENFPTPLLLSPQTQQPVESGAISANAVQWHPIIQAIYGLPVGFVEWLSHWPLQNLPARQIVRLEGTIILDQQPYSNAQVTAEAMRQGAKETIPVQVTDDGKGRFHLQFLTQQSGLYTITFHTSGSFKDSHGDFGTSQRSINVSVVPATLPQSLWALLITVLYLLILFCLGNLIRFFLMPHPFGGWTRSLGGEITRTYSFKQARRGLGQSFFQPNLVTSKQAAMPRGLIFRFRHGGGIEVRAEGRAGADWQYGNGGTVRQTFQEVREMRYRPVSERDDEEDGSEPATYLIKAEQKSGYTRSNLDEDGYGYHSRTSSKRQKRHAGSRRAVRDDEYDDW